MEGRRDGGSEIIPSSPHGGRRLVGHVKSSGWKLAVVVVGACDLRPNPSHTAWRRRGVGPAVVCGGTEGQLYFHPHAACARGPCKRRPSRRVGYQGTPGKVGDQFSSRPLTSVLRFPFLTVTPRPKSLLDTQVPSCRSFVCFPALLPYCPIALLPQPHPHHLSILGRLCSTLGIAIGCAKG